MVIGNGFFADTKEDARAEMQKRKGCKVEPVPFPTIGNIIYYVSEQGDLFGVQKVADKFIAREKKPTRYKIGYSARMSTAQHKEARIPLQLIVWNSFVAKQWTDTELEFKNGNQYDVSVSNLQPKKKEVPKEWTDRMQHLSQIYDKFFNHVCWYANYVSNLDIDDCKDIAQNAFMYLCTDGYRECAYMDERFVGLWCKVAKLRAYDKINFGFRFAEDVERISGGIRNGYEVDLIEVLPGEKQKQYLRLYIEGNTPTEIAKLMGVTLGSVSSSVTRSIKYLRKYLHNERL